MTPYDRELAAWLCLAGFLATLLLAALWRAITSA